jgi:hypothetical protein
MPFENGFLPEMLQQRGYSTYLVVAAVFIQRLFTAYPAPGSGAGAGAGRSWAGCADAKTCDDAAP